MELAARLWGGGTRSDCNVKERSVRTHGSLCDRGLLGWTIATVVGFSIIICDIDIDTPPPAPTKRRRARPWHLGLVPIVSQLWTVDGIVVLVLHNGDCRVREPAAFTFVA